MQTATRAELEPFATGRKPTIYLAGAIHHVPPEFATTWRRAVTQALSDRFNILDPTADKDLYDPDINTKVFTPEQIVTADLDMIFRADTILAEMSRTDIPYHGTSMELAYAYNWKKQIIVWGGCQSYWVRYHATKIFDQMEDALTYILYKDLKG